MVRRNIIAVIGDAGVAPGDPAWEHALALGRCLVDHGFRVVCGGLGGVMEAACRGARSSVAWRDGDTIGLLPGFDPGAANPYVDIAIATGLDIARNLLVANQDGVVAVGGGSGTLAELAYAWQLGRPVVALGDTGWAGELSGRRLDDRPRTDAAGDRIHPAADAAEAVRLLEEWTPKHPGRFPGRR